MSNLEKHAEEEMRRVGLYDADADYGGMIPQAVMKMITAFSSEGHSGGSAGLTLEIFNRLARFRTLSPVTNDPDEWVNVSDFGGPNNAPIWQNRRDGTFFSNDGGKTGYCLDDSPRKIHTFRDLKKP